MPAARYYLGVAVVELKVLASYSCRPMNNVDGARLSEHGHANAIDISALRAGRRAERHGARAGGARWPSATSCARCIAAPATPSPPCSAPATTATIATTSTSTSPATAATAWAASASKRAGCRIGMRAMRRHEPPSTPSAPVARAPLPAPAKSLPMTARLSRRRPALARRPGGRSPSWRWPPSPVRRTCAYATRCCRRSRASSASPSAARPMVVMAFALAYGLFQVIVGPLADTRGKLKLVHRIAVGRCRHGHLGRHADAGSAGAGALPGGGRRGGRHSAWRSPGSATWCPTSGGRPCWHAISPARSSASSSGRRRAVRWAS